MGLFGSSRTQGQPNTLQMILGSIGDTLLQQTGGQPLFLPQLAQRRALAQEEAQYQRRRGDTQNDWRAQQQWKIDHPAPISNDTINDYNFRKQILGEEAARAWLNSASDPTITLTLPGDRVYSGPRSGLSSALGGGNPSPTSPSAPPATLPPDFDFGDGGPTRAASGNFR